MRIPSWIALVGVVAAPVLAADVQWSLSGPAQVNRGDPVVWTASVAVTGSNQGLAGYAFMIAVGPQAGPTAGADGTWGTADDQNVAAVQLPAATWVTSFKVQGASVPGTVKDLATSGGPGMAFFPSPGTSGLPGELLQVGAGHLNWVVPGDVAGVGLDARKGALLANPAGSYVLHSGTIPTSGLAGGTYTVLLVPLRSRVLRPDLNLLQLQPGFVMAEATASGGSFSFTVIVPQIPGDFDHDGDVDLSDLTVFIACATGPRIPYHPQGLPQGCTQTPDGQDRIPADFDQDGDVDAVDFAVFQRCFSGLAQGVLGCAN